MIYADRDIILFNKKLDKESRRDVYIPTQISGVSIYDNRQSTPNGGFHVESEAFKIRIPLSAEVQDGRTYLPESHYDALTVAQAQAHWTLHNEDMMIITAPGFENVNTSAFETVAVTIQQAEKMANLVGFQKELVHIVDYSDNTLRGSNAVKHWRVGGA